MAETQEEPKTKLRFIGSYNHTMDAKGRMVIPQVFRDQLGDTFCMAPSLDFSSIAIYPNEKWEERSHAYEKLGKLNPGLNKYLEQFYAMSYDNQTCDGQGRVLLPANLRQKVLKDDREVEITGANDYVRVVTAAAAADAWEKFRSELPDLLEMIGRLEQQSAGRE